MAFLEYRTNLVAHWRADSLVTLAHGDEVTSWTDEINGYTMTGAAGAVPVYQENQLNGRPALLFNGVDEYLTCNQNWSALLNGSGQGVFVAVFKLLAMPAPSGYA